MNGMVTNFLRMGCGHVNRVATCEPGFGRVNWLVTFEQGVVICKRGVVV